MGDDGFYTVLQELNEKVDLLTEELTEAKEGYVVEEAPCSIPKIPAPRTDREFELAYRLMHPTPGGNPRCTW